MIKKEFEIGAHKLILHHHFVESINRSTSRAIPYKHIACIEKHVGTGKFVKLAIASSAMEDFIEIQVLSAYKDKIDALYEDLLELIGQ